MSFIDSIPGYRLESEDQIKNWILELVEESVRARDACNVEFPGDRMATITHQRKAYAIFMVKHGAALGALLAFHRSGKIGDVLYNEMRERVLATLAPTIVGGT